MIVKHHRSRRPLFLVLILVLVNILLPAHAQPSRLGPFSQGLFASSIVKIGVAVPGSVFYLIYWLGQVKEVRWLISSLVNKAIMKSMVDELICEFILLPIIIRIVRGEPTLLFTFGFGLLSLMIVDVFLEFRYFLFNFLFFTVTFT